MDRRPEDLAFARYCQDGDPAALAEVFDHAAPQLLLLAQHLLREPHDAEDAVQETFLQAIRSAGRYRQDRAVLPWLVGILGNVASALRRRARRALDPSRLPAEPRSDPAQEAAERDEVRSLLLAIHALPDPFREVLVLHLVHGLETTAIAHAKGVPPETIRTRLHRGLARLRTRLPAARALVPLPAFGEAGRLAALRTAVLARAADARLLSAAAGPGILLPLLTMKKLAAMLLLALLALLGIQWLLPSRGAIEPLAEASAARSAAATRPDAGGPPTLARAALAPPTATAAGSRVAREIEVYGTAVAAESGAPLAGARVEVWVLHGEARWRDPEDLPTGRHTLGQSDADGRFAVRLAPTLGAWHRLAVWRGDEGVAISGTLEALVPGTRSDLGRIAVARGARVRGRVLDTGGRPCADLRVCVSPRMRAFGSQLTEWLELQATTDAQGEFAFDTPLWPGVHEVADVGSHTLVSPAEFAVAADTRELVLDLRVREAHPENWAGGVLLDQAGAPVAGVEVELAGPLHSSDWSTLGPRVRSGPDGRFRAVSGRPAPLGSAGLLVHGAGVASDLSFAQHPVALGRDDNEVRLAVTTTRVALEVVDEASGAPIEEYGVRIDGPGVGHGWIGGFANLLRAGRHPGGRLLLPVLAPGTHRLLVVPLVPGASLPSFARFDPATWDGTPLRVAVPRPHALRVRAATAAGLPLAGVDVRLVLPLREDHDRDEDSLAWELGHPPIVPHERHGRGRTVASLLLAEARTDATGTATFAAPPGHRLRVLVPGPGFPETVGPAIPPGGAEATLVLDPGCAVRITLDPEARSLLASGSSDGATSARLSVFWSDAEATHRRDFVLDRSGTTLCGGLPALTARMELLAPVGFAPGDLHRIPLDAPLALRPGPPLEWTVRGADLGYGHVRIRFVFDDAPIRHCTGEILHGHSDGAPSRVESMLTDGEGFLRQSRLPPGRYRLTLAFEDPAAGRTRTLHMPEDLEVARGATIDRTVVLRAFSYRVRARRADGRIVPAGRLILRGGDGMDLDAEPDAAQPGAGWVTVRDVPWEAIEVLERAGDEARPLCTIRAQPGAAQTVAECTAR